LNDIELGETDTEGVIVNVKPLDVTPPDVTVTVAVPAVAIRLAATDAVTCPAFTYVVVSADPFQFTTAPETKPLPFTVSVSAGPPAVVLAGLSELIAGAIEMLNGSWFDSVPAAFATAILAVPAVVSRVAGIVAAIWAASIRLGWMDTAAPPGGANLTESPIPKLVPAMLTGEAELPTTTPDGVTEVIEGTGADGGLIVKVAPLDVTSPDVTVTVAAPAVAIRLAATEAVSCPAFTYVVVSADPFQFTTAPEAKPLPFTVSVSAGPPAVALAGLNELIAGPAAVTGVTVTSAH
jgi:hypothetical protein